MNIRHLTIKKIYFLLLVTCSLTPLVLGAQDFVDELSDTSSLEQDGDISSYPTEVISKIAPSKKIMLLSNTNNSYQEGDYLSLITEKKLMIRVLCAKMMGPECGIKLIKIYEDQIWLKAYPGIKVQVLRGDDAQFKLDQSKKVDAKDEIESLEDLYKDDDLLSDDNLEVKGKQNRSLKNDNIIGLSYGLLDGVDINKEAHRYAHWHAQWAYQLADNIWGEAMIGTAVVGQFPNDTLTTQVTSLTLRFKYTFATPFYSFVLPYIGYQQVMANSPDAGTPYSGSTAAILEDELTKLDLMKQSRVVFGVTILKRIVPGWFLRADLGTDFISAGLSLEF